MFRTAVEAAVDSVDHGIDRGAVDEAYVGTLGVGGRQIGLSAPAVTEHVGLDGTPATRVENACAASGYAVRQAVMAVRSGMADVVLAGGVEVMTDLSGDTVRYWLGVSGETEWERLSGATFAGVYAQMASVHMREHGTTTDQLSAVAVKNHDNGARNPKAQLDFTCTLEEATAAPTVADPLTLYHCCPTTDGAAAVLVASEDVVDDYAADPVRVAGVGAAADRVGLFRRDSYTSIPASRRAADAAYDAAGRQRPPGGLDAHRQRVLVGVGDGRRLDARGLEAAPGVLEGRGRHPAGGGVRADGQDAAAHDPAPRRSSRSRTWTTAAPPEPPTLWVSPTAGASSPRSPARPVSWSKASTTWPAPVAPMGWPFDFSPPEVLTGSSPSGSVAPDSTYGPAAPRSQNRRSS